MLLQRCVFGTHEVNKMAIFIYPDLEQITPNVNMYLPIHIIFGFAKK